MPTRAIQFYPGDCYHLYNRGNNRENIVVVGQTSEVFKTSEV